MCKVNKYTFIKKANKWSRRKSWKTMEALQEGALKLKKS